MIDKSHATELLQTGHNMGENITASLAASFDGEIGVQDGSVIGLSSLAHAVSQFAATVAFMQKDKRLYGRALKLFQSLLEHRTNDFGDMLDTQLAKWEAAGRPDEYEIEWPEIDNSEEEKEDD